MYTYRIVLDAFNSGRSALSFARPTRGARVVTYSQGFSRADAIRKIGTVMIAQDGTVSDGIRDWPGARNLPAGPYESRGLPEWDVVSIRSVKRLGTARIVHETN